MGNDYPNSRLYLCNVPFSKDYEHTIDFPNFTTQFDYFSSVSSKSYQNFSYIRETGTIQVDEYKETILNNNYLIFWNNDKWYFAFIDSIEYINNSCSEIFFTIDVFQTYLFDFRFVSCFVEREHVSDDTVGLHTVPENLETGERIYGNNAKYEMGNTGIVVMSNVDLKNYSDVAGVFYNGVYGGYKMYYYTGSLNLKDDIENLAKEGKAEAILGIFIAPARFIGSVENNEISESSTAISNNWNLGNKPTTLLGYQPKNNKLLVYPFNFLTLTNNQGSVNILHFELFNTNDIQFKIYGSLTPGMSIRILPLNYKNVSENNLEGINAGKFPTCSWNSDMYTNWLTQNSLNLQTNTVSNILSGAGGVSGEGKNPQGQFMNSIGSFATNAFSAITNTLSEVYTKSFQPPVTSGNLNSGDVTFSSDKNTFECFQTCIKPEYAKIIDDYFSMYGYQVNDVKVPNVNTRPNWNYLKTTGTTVRANIPQNHLDTLNSIFNKGITIWHSPNVIYNYNLNNK